MPANTVKVDRTTEFGNPFHATTDRENSVKQFGLWLISTKAGETLARRARTELRGKNLACWCPLDKDCHADLLLQVARSKRVLATQGIERDAATKEKSPLDDLFRYELKTRSSTEGLALAALDGDREALKAFAAFGSAALDSYKGPDSVACELMQSVLDQISADVEPNVAFGWARARRGRPGPRQDFAALQRAWLLATHVAGLLETRGNVSMSHIYREVAEARHSTIENVRIAWDWFNGTRRRARK